MLIRPDWPAPNNIRALATTRLLPVGASVAPESRYSSFNLASHVDDNPRAVQAHRRALLANAAADGLREVYWLNQTHSTTLVEVPRDRDIDLSACPDADASISRRCGVASAVLTADCLPVLLCNRGGFEVAAVHAGWRGLCQGILLKAVAQMMSPSQQLLAWLGPAISAEYFEVGAEVREAFLRDFAGPSAAEINSAFSSPHTDRAGVTRYFADLYALARMQLKALGVSAIYGGEFCTYGDAERFFSYRREPRCGRQASLIWISENP